MSVANPLIAASVDDVVKHMTTLFGNVADGAEFITGIRTYLETTAVQDEMVKQALSLYAMTRRTDSAQHAILLDAQGQL